MLRIERMPGQRSISAASGRLNMRFATVSALASVQALNRNASAAIALGSCSATR